MTNLSPVSETTATTRTFALTPADPELDHASSNEAPGPDCPEELGFWMAPVVWGTSSNDDQTMIRPSAAVAGCFAGGNL